MIESILEFKLPSEQQYREKENELEKLDLKNHPSLEDGIEELRRLYDEEEDRRKSVEAKTSGIIAINGVILGIIQATLMQNMSDFSSSLVLSAFSVSTILSIRNLRSINYWRSINVNNIQTIHEKIKRVLLDNIL